MNSNVTNAVSDVGTRREHEDRTFRGVLDAILRTWKIPLLVSIVAFIALMASIVIVRQIVPTTTTYISRIQFVFPGVSQGRYPSGLPFTVSEVIDPQVLGAIYDRFELGRYRVTKEDFYTGVSVRPYTPTEGEIAERYRIQLSDRRLTFAERERIEGVLKTRLEQESRGAAEISWVLRKRFEIPVSLGRQVMQAIPLEWSRQAIEKKGVIKIAGSSSTEQIISPEISATQPVPIAILMLSEGAQRLTSRLEQLKLVPGIQSMRDAASGKSFRDIEREFRDLEFFSVNPLRTLIVRHRLAESPDQHEVESLIQRRIRDLELLEDERSKQASTFTEALNRYVDAMVGLKGRTVERRGTGAGESGQVVVGGNTIPQIGDSFIDRIIELTGRRRDDEQLFISDLTRRQLEVNDGLVSIRAEKERWLSLISEIRANAGTQEILNEKASANAREGVRHAISGLNAVWAALTRMESEFAANRVGQTGQLYSSFAIPSDVTQYNPAWNRTNLATAFATAFLLGLALWMVRAFLYWRRREPSLP